MRFWLVAVVVLGCGGDPKQLPLDAMPDSMSTSDAMTDATPVTWTIDVAATTIVADALEPSHAITITGAPNAIVEVSLDRAAGHLSPALVTLDGAGAGTATLIPCNAVVAGCVGDATLQLAEAGAPDGVFVATDSLTLVARDAIGEVAPCQTSDNVLHVHGNSTAFTGQHQTAPAAQWTVETTPGQIELVVEGFHASFSSRQLASALQPGTYPYAKRINFESFDEPGIMVRTSSICNAAFGRFEVHDFDADPVSGQITSATISFEQQCDSEPALLRGCFHYTSTVPAAPPSPDPAKVNVQVYTRSGERIADPMAKVIFYDSNNNVVADTTTNSWGQAAATLASGGSVTVIQQTGVDIYLYAYRGLVTGDVVVINPNGLNAPTGQMAAVITPVVETPATSTTAAVYEVANVLLGCVAVGSQPGWTFLDQRLAALFTLRPECRASTFDLLTVSTRSDGARSFVWLTNLPHVANSFVAAPAGATWTPMGTQSVSLENVPSGLVSLAVTTNIVIDGQPHAMGNSNINAPTSGAHQMTLVYPTGAGDATQLDISITAGLARQGTSRTVVQTGAPTSLTVDMDSLPLAAPSQVDQSTTGLSWNKTAGSATVREVFWRGQSASHRFHWRVYEPYTNITNWSLPTLPAAHAALDPRATANVEVKGAGVIHRRYSNGGTVLGPPTGSYSLHMGYAENAAAAFPF